jgi:peroxiredoxin
MTIKIGDRLPDATFKVSQGGDISDLTVAELTAGKKVVLFAVPGAFHPVCHARHVPSYLEHYAALKAKGVDTIACLAVNDPFILANGPRPSAAATRSCCLQTATPSSPGRSASTSTAAASTSGPAPSASP